VAVPSTRQVQFAPGLALEAGVLCQPSSPSSEPSLEFEARAPPRSRSVASWWPLGDRTRVADKTAAQPGLSKLGASLWVDPLGSIQNASAAKPKHNPAMDFGRGANKLISLLVSGARRSHASRNDLSYAQAAKKGRPIFSVFLARA
jgi:hypothetical protein